MQKLTIINLGLNESIEFGMAGNNLLSHIEGLGKPPAVSYNTQSPLQDGSSSHGILLADRVIRANITIRAKNREELYKKRREIQRIINPKTYCKDTGNYGELLLYYTNDYKTYRIYAQVEDEVDFKSRINNVDKSQIVFVCHDPYLYDEEDIEENIKSVEGGLEFELELETEFATIVYYKEINNISDTEIPIIIRYSGIATNPVIINETTGEFIKINRTLQEGQLLLINTEDGEQTVTIIDEDGNSFNAYNYLDLSSTFFKLAIGKNLIKYYSDTSNALDIVKVKRSNRYVGV